MNKDRFDYYLEFMAMRLEDTDFSMLYGVSDYDKWYSDYMKMLIQERVKTE